MSGSRDMIQRQSPEMPDPDLGRAMLTFIRQRTGLLEWCDPERACLNNGSAFFVQTAHASFGVTARHVYEAFEETAANGPLVAQLNNLPVNLLSRLIAKGHDTDIATFEILAHEIDRLQIQPVPWPPHMPAEGKTVLFGGYPGIGKRFTGPKEITWGIHHGLARVDGFNDRDISMVTPPNDELMDLSGTGLPPRNMNAGGMSGGPVITPFREVAGEFTYSLSAVIYECQASLEIMKAARADVIDERGHVHG